MRETDPYSHQMPLQDALPIWVRAFALLALLFALLTLTGRDGTDPEAHGLKTVIDWILPAETDLTARDERSPDTNELP